MKTNSDKIRSKKSYRKYFIILPIVFLLCGYLLFFACLTPILDPLVSAYNLAFSKAETIIEEQGTNSTFNGGTGLFSGNVDMETFKFPSYGDHFGNIKVEGTEIDAALIYGDDTPLLKKGACMSLFSHIPGSGTGTFVGAHNNTYFHTLQYVKNGAKVTVETTYGSYVYKVYNTKIIKNTDRAAYEKELNGDKDILILYTCYPNNMIALTPDRFFVFCELVSGPSVNLYE